MVKRTNLSPHKVQLFHVYYLNIMKGIVLKILYLTTDEYETKTRINIVTYLYMT